MGKRYIRYFGIPELTAEQLQQLDNMTDKQEIENLLFPCYFGTHGERTKTLIKGYMKLK